MAREVAVSMLADKVTELEQAQEQSQREQQEEEGQSQETAYVKPSEHEGKFGIGDKMTFYVDGKPIEAEVVQTEDVDGVVVQTSERVNGHLINQYTREELDALTAPPQQANDNADVVSPKTPEAGAEVQNETEEEKSPDELPAFDGDKFNETHPVDEIRQPQEEQKPNEENNAVEASAISKIPQGESGEYDYMQAEPSNAWDALLEQTEGDADMAREVAQSMLNDKVTELEQAQKQQPKEGKSVAEKIAARKEHKANIERIESEIERWQQIIQSGEDRQAGEKSRSEEADETPAVDTKSESGVDGEEKSEDMLQPIGKGVFGNIYDQFKGKVKEAFDFLTKHKSGDLLGVFHRDGFGDIDLVWGDNGGGLAHIIQRHVEEQNDFNSVEEVRDVIDDVIKNGSINEKKSKWDKVVFEKDGYSVIVSRNLRDKDGNIIEQNKDWVVTAFDNSRGRNSKKRESSSDVTQVTPNTNKEGRAVAPNDNSPESKDTESKTEGQEKSEESKEKEEKPLSEKGGKVSEVVNVEPTEAQKPNEGSNKNEDLSASENGGGKEKVKPQEELKPKKPKNEKGEESKADGASAKSADEQADFVVSRVKDFDNGKREETGAEEAMKKESGLSFGNGRAKRSVKLRDFIPDRRSEHQEFRGIHYDNGMAVVSDGYRLVAIRTEYPAEYEGRTLMPNGREAKGRFPNWRVVVPNVGIEIGTDWLNRVLGLQLEESDNRLVSFGGKPRATGVMVGELLRLAKLAEKISNPRLFYAQDRLLLTGDGVVCLQMLHTGIENEDVSLRDFLNGNVPSLHRAGESNGELTKAEVALRDAVIDRLRENGIDVVTDVSEGQRVLDMANGKERLSGKQKRALETASLGNNPRSLTVVSSADGAKVLQNVDELANKLDKSATQPKTFIGDVAKALGAKRLGSDSEYATFETKNGLVVTIRLSNHNAHVSGFDYNGRDNGISIVISPKPNEKIKNDGNAHITEFYYNAIKLRRADGKPLAEIVRSIKQALYSGEFKDTTGIAERQEVNGDVVREHRVYHGSGADFEAFDHSHMGEGEGAQAYGWGTYVTEVEGIGRTYAEQYVDMHRPSEKELEELWEDVKNDAFIEADISTREKYGITEPIFIETGYYVGDADTEALLKEACAYYGYDVADYYDEDGDIDEDKCDELFSDLFYDMDSELENELNNRKSDFIEEHSKDLNPILYTVEIPDDTGENYLDWNGRADRLIDRVGISEEEYEKNDMVNGEDVYKYLSQKLGSDKAASKALSEMGFTGIKYPAENRSGGRKDGARNYVIFNEGDAKIVDKVRFFKTQGGEAYGFTVGGKIYIDPHIASSETAVHEYAHLWAEALRSSNAKEWENVVGLMRGTSVWNEVSERYPELKSDDEIADEVLATYSGRRGSERLREEMDRIKGSERSVADKARALGALERVRRALDRFWHGVADFLGIHYKSADEVADRVMRDLLSGVDPRRFVSGESIKENITKNERTLAGVHNITEEKLRKALKLGGLANPSVAVIDTEKQGHSGFGEISLIAPSSLVNKRTGRNAGTFFGDAWTPTYPQVERIFGKGGSDRAIADIASVPEEMQRMTRNAIDSFMDGKNADNLVYLYLQEKGIAPQLFKTKGVFSSDIQKKVISLTNGQPFYKLNETGRNKVVELYIEYKFDGNRDAFKKALQERVAKLTELQNEYKNPKSLLAIRVKEHLENIDNYGYDYEAIGRFVDDVNRDAKVSGKVSDIETMQEARNIVEKENLQKDFEQWKESLADRYNTKEVIFNGFTPSGNRRYVDNTLENVSKIMKRKGRNGAEGFGFSFNNFAANIMQSSGTLKGIKERKAQLTQQHEDVDAFIDKWAEVYNHLADALNPNADISTMDVGYYRLQETAVQKEPKEFAKKEYGVELSDEDVQQLNDMVKAIREERPTMYFETKFERPVMFNEFKAAVVPNNVSDEVRKALEQSGLTIFTYDPNVKSDRQRATNEAMQSSEDIRFQKVGDVNEQFNKELDEFKNGTHKGLLHLGKPRGILKQCGITAQEMTISPSVLHKHLKKHNLTTDDLKGLAESIQRPILVYKHGLNNPNMVVVTELNVNGGKLSVSFVLDESGKVVEVSNISSVHSKDATKELERLYEMGEIDFKKSLKWVEKEKVLDWLAPSSYENSGMQDNQAPFDIAKILKGFENPKVSDGKRVVDSYDGDLETLFRDADSPVDYERALIRDSYERRLKDVWFQSREALQDGMLSLKETMKDIWRSAGKKFSQITDIPDYANPYLGQNRLSSRNAAEVSDFKRRLFRPLLREVGRLTGFSADGRAKLTDYMMAKHGLERNKVMAERVAKHPNSLTCGP